MNKVAMNGNDGVRTSPPTYNATFRNSNEIRLLNFAKRRVAFPSSDNLEDYMSKLSVMAVDYIPCDSSTDM